jgi:hypothetical protein
MLKKIPNYDIAVDPRRIHSVNIRDKAIVIKLKEPDDVIELSLSLISKPNWRMVFDEIIDFANQKKKERK